MLDLLRNHLSLHIPRKNCPHIYAIKGYINESHLLQGKREKVKYIDKNAFILLLTSHSCDVLQTLFFTVDQLLFFSCTKHTRQ